jgi:hypothetical protein
MVLLKPDPAHDADPENMLYILCSLHFISMFRYRSWIECCGSGAAPQFSFRSRIRSLINKVQFVDMFLCSEPHQECSLAAHFFTQAWSRIRNAVLQHTFSLLGSGPMEPEPHLKMRSRSTFFLSFMPIIFAVPCLYFCALLFSAPFIAHFKSVYCICYICS